MTFYVLKVKLSKRDTREIVSIIRQTRSRMSSPITLLYILQNIKMQATLMEYCLKQKRGWAINTPRGDELIGLANTGNHYQIWLLPGSELNTKFCEAAVEMFPRSNDKKQKTNEWQTSKSSRRRARRRKNKQPIQNKQLIQNKQPIQTAWKSPPVVGCKSPEANQNKILQIQQDRLFALSLS